MSAVTTQSLAKRFEWGALLRLIRWNNLALLGFTQYMVKIFLIDITTNFTANFSNPQLALLVIATITIAAAGYIINDYYDIKIDTINKPEQVVIGKSLKRRVAISLHTVFNFIGIGIAFFWLTLEITTLNFTAAFLLWLYSNQLKRQALIGNLTIALLTALSVIAVGLLFPQNQDIVMVFAMFAFFSTLIREIVKDMEDVKGDEVFGCRTLPIIWGIRRTKNIIYIFFAIFTLILLSTYLSFPNQFTLYLYLVELPMLSWFLWRLKKADTKKDFYFLSQLCKVIMLMGVVSMVFV
jgi:4-hydroxybenzoate polyprenyltransferase